MRSRSFLVPLLVCLVALGAGAGAWLYLARGSTAAMTIGGAFTLHDGDGKTVTDRDLRGRFLLVYFGYTSCPDVCPTTLSEVARALDELGPKADQVQPLFISVDPQRDTPQVVHDFAAAFSPRIIGLTGSAAEIAEAAGHYRAYYAPHTGDGAGSYTVDHSSILYLMGPDGDFIAPIRSDEPGEAIAASVAKYLK